MNPARPAYRVAPRAVRLWVTEGAVTTAVLLVLTIVAQLVVPADPPRAVSIVVTAAPWLALAYGVVAVGIRPQVRYRVHRWEVSAEAVHTVEGWLTTTAVLIPVARIQTVDVTRGVLQRAFGLASVAVFTASSQGTLHVVHLTEATATAVAGDLTRRAQTTRDEAT